MTNGFVLATDPMLPPHGLEGAVYAIGNFDGLHLGHQAVIERAVALARERAAPSAILTFEPHPADFFAGRPVAFRLTPAREKAEICASARTRRHRLPPLRRLARGDERRGVRRKGSRRPPRRRRRGRRLGLSFRQGPIRFAGHPRRGRPEARLRRRDRGESRSRRRRSGPRRVLERDSQGSRAGRPRRRGAGSWAQLFGQRPGHFRPAPGTHPRRPDGEYRARADQPARARNLCGRGAGRRARFSRRRQLWHPADGR